MKSFLKGAFGATVVLLIFYFAGCQSGGNNERAFAGGHPSPQKPLVDSGGSGLVLNPVAPSHPRTVTVCKGDTCTLMIATDTSAYVPGNNKLLDVVFTSQADLRAGSKIELRIYQKMDTADVMRIAEVK